MKEISCICLQYYNTTIQQYNNAVTEYVILHSAIAELVVAKIQKMMDIIRKQLVSPIIR